ncbi:alpha/beta hydrolase [Phenylobacterium sp.]|jgi:acetyl esterase/lipase|uniref:alpha/beta hydrolase n=1 Tax=Phenylobacterium sp. TaxID=1871053 RepID=UPI002F42E61D
MASPSLQRFLLRRVLSLPSPILRLMSGGRAVHRHGRTLDPRLQVLAAAARGRPSISTLTPTEARAAVAQGMSPLFGRPEPGVRVEPLALEGPAGPLTARVYRPAEQDPRFPPMVYAHAGGGVLGDLEACHIFCQILAAVAGVAVVSVAYRLAPEDRFPAGLEDMAAAYRWVRDHAGDFGAAPGDAMIGGDSMGGNFAAVIAQDLKRAGEPQPALQLLIYPCTDIASETSSMTAFADAFPLDRAAMAWFTGHYLGPEDNPADPRLSPGRTADLGGLAPAVIATAGHDPLLDQGEAYARALRDAGVAVAYRSYDSLTHGFTSYTGAAPAADAACREIAGLVRATLQAGFA